MGHRVTPSREHFLNRELQALEFNRRVLAMAEDRSVPLLERLRFLCIVSSNLDEFFEIRLSGLKEQIKLGAAGVGPDGVAPRVPRASSSASTAFSTKRSSRRSRRSKFGSCAAPRGPPRSRNGSRITSSAR
jgi:polyphosphate kinase